MIREPSDAGVRLAAFWNVSEKLKPRVYEKTGYFLKISLRFGTCRIKTIANMTYAGIVNTRVARTNIVVSDEMAPSCFQPMRRPNHRPMTYKGRQISVYIGDKASRTPTVVATPFPPFHPQNGLQQCPAIAAIPIAHATCGGTPRESRRTAIRPLVMSPMSAIAARGFVDTRRTLLKPGFFEPTLVISIPVPHMATFANGMAPIAKQANILRRYVGSNYMMGEGGRIKGTDYSTPKLLRNFVRSLGVE